MGNEIKDYDRWKLASGQDDEKVFCECEQCGGEIYEGEEYLEVDDCNIHHECFDDFAWKLLQPRFRTAGEE
jgi:hypothetical protein